MAAEPVRLTSIIPSGIIRSIKALTFSALPVTSKTKEFRVLSTTRARTEELDRLLNFGQALDLARRISERPEEDLLAAGPEQFIFREQADAPDRGRVIYLMPWKCDRLGRVCCEV